MCGSISSDSSFGDTGSQAFALPGLVTGKGEGSIVYLSAFASLSVHSGSKVYYDMKRSLGSRHNAALMCCARTRLKAVWAILPDANFLILMFQKCLTTNIWTPAPHSLRLRPPTKVEHRAYPSLWRRRLRSVVSFHELPGRKQHSSFNSLDTWNCHSILSQSLFHGCRSPVC